MHSYPLNVKADYLSWGQLLLEWHLLPQMAQTAFCLWGLPKGDLLASSCTLNATIITPCKVHYLWGSWDWMPSTILGCFTQGMFPPPALVPLVLSKFLAEHVKSQLRHLVLVAPCWMEAPLLPTFLIMLADVPPPCSMIKDLTMDVLVGNVLKGLVYLHLTLGCSEMCVSQTQVLFLSLSGSGRGNSNIYVKGLPAVLKRMCRLVCSRGCTKKCHICP